MPGKVPRRRCIDQRACNTRGGNTEIAPGNLARSGFYAGAFRRAERADFYRDFFLVFRGNGLRDSFFRNAALGFLFSDGQQGGSY